MSEIKVGDTVKFLNSSGGGVVSRIIDSRMVGVMIEDGFEIPTMTGELVVVAATGRAARFFEEKFPVHVSGAGEQERAAEEHLEESDRLAPLPKEVTASRINEEIFLAYIPHDQKWLITGQVDVVLVNNTGYDLLYNLFAKTALNHFEGVDYGNVFAGNSLVLSTVNREQLTRWSDGYIQFLFHCVQTGDVLPPFNAEFRVDGKKFYREGNYRPHPVIKEKGIVVRLLSLTSHFISLAAAKDDPVPPAGGTRQENLPVALIRKYETEPGEAEIDLHIHELIEDPSNLEKSEMLDIQKNYFLKCLDSAMAEHFRRITVIHGVGSGTLRSELMELLKKQEGISVSDAPMSKYGAGALDIRIGYRN